MTAAGLRRGGRRIRARLRAARGWPLLLLLFALGAVGVLAHAPFHVQPALILALVVLVWSLDDACVNENPARAGFARAWAFASGQFFAGTSWVANAFLVSAGDHAWLIWAPLILLPGGLALFWGAAGALYARFAPRGPARVLVFAGLFVLAEALRATILSGFPWNLPGHVFPAGGAMSQIASVIGASGLSAFTLLAFSAPAALIGPGTALKRAIPVAAGFAVLAGFQVFGVARLASAEAEASGLVVRVVQVNIDQRDKRYEDRAAILERYLDLSAAPGLESVDALVWPEGAIPGFLLNDPPLLARIRDRLPQGLILFTGVVRVEFAPTGEVSDYYNALAALRLGEEVTLDATYDKARLVPFGEINPLRSLTRLIGFQTLAAWTTGYTAGPGGETLDIEGLSRVAPLICYEVVYPRHAPGGAQRPAWLLNISNDSWFGNSAGPRQHANQARYRALESGLPLARAASSGVSGLTDPYGRPRRVLGIEEERALDLALPTPLKETIYARQGEGPWMIAFISALIVLGRLSSLGRAGRAATQGAARSRHRL
ncbi:MAG: apolipoprotein N-acyltransferase [Oceanicaulis sp.]